MIIHLMERFLSLVIGHEPQLSYWFMMQLVSGSAKSDLVKVVLPGGQVQNVIRYIAWHHEDVINDLIGVSITYRVAVGKNKGKKVYTLQTIPTQIEEMERNKVLAKESGFSLHAGVSAKSYQKEKIERLCRYITRPAVSLKRLRLSETGKVIYELKNPYKNGTTHVVFEPLDFIARLAALVSRPRKN